MTSNDPPLLDAITIQPYDIAKIGNNEKSWLGPFIRKIFEILNRILNSNSDNFLESRKIKLFKTPYLAA